MFYTNRIILTKQILIVLMCVISSMLIVSLFGVSCQSGSQSESSRIEWLADGVINNGEYSSTASYANGKYDLYWTSDEKYIYMGVRAVTEGFVAIGFSTSGMLGADAIFGFVKNDKAFVYDIHIDDYSAPHVEDADIGGTNDLVEFGAKEADGYTTIEFKRALDTGDEYDNVILKGEDNSIVWSYGKEDNMSDIHYQRGYGKIQP